MMTLYGKLVDNRLLVGNVSHKINYRSNAVCIGWFLVLPIGNVYAVLNFVEDVKVEQK